MKTIKPFRLSILTRPYQWRGNTRLGIGIYTLAKQTHTGWELEPEQKLWSDVLYELDSDGMLDQVMPKANPEYLISGCAYTHSQTTDSACIVKAEIDNLEKQLLVTGDRYWIGDKPSKAQSFSKLPITWSNAFGGTASQKNPLGKGLDEVDVGDIKATPLPNVESPVQQISTKSDRPEPVSFGPIAPHHPDRVNMAGTYSEEWFKYDFPGFLPDMNPRIFNMAPDDQQWTALDELPKGAQFKIWNMHPKKNCWEGSLPRLTVRAFIQSEKKESSLQEVESMVLSTAWFLPERESVIMLFHGTLDIEDEDGDDITAIMGAVELEGNARPRGHYEDVFALRCDPEHALDYALEDSQLVSHDLIGPTDDSVDYSLDKSKLSVRIDKFIKTQEAYTSNIMQKYGIEEKDYESEFVGPDIELSSMTDQEREEYFQHADEAANEELKEIIRQVRADDPKSAQMLDEIEKIINSDSEDDNIKIPVIGPPDLSHFDADEINRIESPEAGEKFNEQSQRLKGYARKSYLYTAQHQQTAPRMSSEKNQLIRQDVLTKYEKNRDLTKLDLTGADLSGLTFEDADFSESFLENALFSNCHLKNVNFSEAVLVRSHFINCTFEDVNFTKTSLAEAKIEACQILRSKFLETNIEDIHFFQSSLQKSRFEMIAPDRIEWVDSKFLECAFDMCLLSDGVIRNSIFVEADFFKTLFDNMQVINASFNTSVLKDSAFSAGICEDTAFNNSTLNNVMFEESSQILNCKFSASRLHECNFMETKMHSIQFVKCNMTGSDFTKAILHHCNFDSVVAREATFYKSDLTGSSFRYANLIQATFEKSNLADCDFSNATMFRTNVSKVKLTPETKFDGTFRDQLEVYPIFRDQLNASELFTNE